MAMAVAANSLKLRLQLFVPHSTLPLMVDKLKVETTEQIFSLSLSIFVDISTLILHSG